MKPAYIILTETGERIDLCQANEFNPNEFDLSFEFSDRLMGFYYTALYPEESYCYKPDLDPDGDEPTTATTVGFKVYDSDGNTICQNEGGNGIWL
jgi:hypothetical protein